MASTSNSTTTYNMASSTSNPDSQGHNTMGRTTIPAYKMRAHVHAMLENQMRIPPFQPALPTTTDLPMRSNQDLRIQSSTINVPTHFPIDPMCRTDSRPVSSSLNIAETGPSTKASPSTATTTLRPTATSFEPPQTSTLNPSAPAWTPTHSSPPLRGSSAPFYPTSPYFAYGPGHMEVHNHGWYMPQNEYRGPYHAGNTMHHEAYVPFGNGYEQPDRRDENAPSEWNNGGARAARKPRKNRGGKKGRNEGEERMWGGEGGW
ncbi:hypothetical protein GQ44DRAFT_701994 [Phaeosphaeriaceae sp. PMI808]|nr:hypothetical protein GQ44DRAFT_701994 [Phaeosphaeriaceae sp. PMI808]